MKTISIFFLLIYWSIMIFGPIMSKNYKILDKNELQILKSRGKLNIQTLL